MHAQPDLSHRLDCFYLSAQQIQLVVARLFILCCGRYGTTSPWQEPATRYKQHIPLHLAMLTGEELLAKVKEMGGASKSEVVKACGYVSQKKDGSDRLNFTAFYEALLEAKGVGIGSGGGVGKGGRKLSYKAVVQGNGNLLVGKAYTALLNLVPGDEFEIKLSKKKGVTLVPKGEEEETEEG